MPVNKRKQHPDSTEIAWAPLMYYGASTNYLDADLVPAGCL